MAGQRKIVVFTGNPAYSVRKGIVDIDMAMPGMSWLILVHSPRKKPGQLLKNQWRKLRWNGWRWIPYQTADIWHRLVRHNPADPSLACPGSNFTMSALESRPNMRLVRVTDIHAQESLDMVEAFEPDLGLSLAAPILRRPLFLIPRLGTINLHKGKVPDYRGMPPAFWEVWNGEKSVGCTVHWVEEKLDTGDIIHQTTVEREKFSTIRGLQLRLDEVGVDLMRKAVKDILDGTPARLPQGSGGNTYRKPTLAQIATLERKLLRSQTPDSSFPVRLLKDSRSILGIASQHMGLGRILTPRITVLLYHRVSDDVRNNLTVGVEQFDRQMALLRKHCQPLSIQQVLECREIPRSGVPLVAVTFDDSYLDNYMNAATILLRHGIPAAFFVSTGIVNTERFFPHDTLRGNPHIPLMEWDHLRTMRDWGFTIGSHTVTHIDCATEAEAEAEETVRAELVQSRDDLRRELGVTDPIFAYPYGSRQHMTPQRLELVKQSGYTVWRLTAAPISVLSTATTYCAAAFIGSSPIVHSCSNVWG